ncbi:MAG: C40 family peptidase [Muribaculum sp.]|nr:C40 family peptidase [Muribaculaceae bacterium]MCM1080752.1 C40 family peptidase [Muribaculum sp.]
MTFATRIFAAIALTVASFVPAMAVSPLMQPLVERPLAPLKASSATQHLLAGIGSDADNADNAPLLAAVNIWRPSLPEIKPVETIIDDEAPEYIADLLGHASTFIGTRYRSGGKKPGGFDCSGFTSYIFSQFGISLNASSGSQYTQGEQVENESLRPGDLVFFAGRSVSRKRVGHVGIVTEICPDGTFRFIHSACKSGVVISHSQEPYYKRRYIGARRVE